MTDPDAPDLTKVIPEEGDSVTIVNRGTHYYMVVHAHPTPKLSLTNEDIYNMTNGLTIWH